MEIRCNANGTYRVAGDNRTYKTMQGARNRARALAKTATCPRPATACRTDVEAMARAARPLPDNVYTLPLIDPVGPTTRGDLGADATVLRIEFLHRGYTAVWNVSADRPVAGPVLVQEWKNAGGRAAWRKENGPRRFKTDRERVAEHQKNDGRLR